MNAAGFLVSALPSTLVALAAGLGWWRATVRLRHLAQRMTELEQLADSGTRTNEALQKALREMEEAASVDRLTGAWNRRRFEEAAAAEMALARRRRAPVSLAILDLDHFKRVNDTHGHGAGDLVLAEAAATFRRELRTSDALVRWGGEEFLVLLPATSLIGAATLAEKLRTALEVQRFTPAYIVTVSAGVAEHLPDESLGTWIERADRALYRAKAEGRNRVEVDETAATDAMAPAGNLLELIWEEAYGSGNQLIDTQHQRLFNASNALLSALVGGQPPLEIALRLDTLLAHTAQHFHDEEQLLRQAAYPDLKEHMAEHARLLAGAGDLQREARAGQLDFGRLVTYLATDLVKGHLLTEDRHYFGHLHASLPNSQG